MDINHDDYPDRLARALVDEIWTEMGRQRITSVRALALASGMLPQQLQARLRVDPRTKKPVTINVRDLGAIAAALRLAPHVLIERAEAAVEAVPAPEAEVIEGRFGRLGSAREFAQDAAAHVGKRSIDEEQEVWD